MEGAYYASSKAICQPWNACKPRMQRWAHLNVLDCEQREKQFFKIVFFSLTIRVLRGWPGAKRRSISLIHTNLFILWMSALNASATFVSFRFADICYISHQSTTRRQASHILSSWSDDDENMWYFGDVLFILFSKQSSSRRSIYIEKNMWYIGHVSFSE